MFEQYAQKSNPDGMKAGLEQVEDPAQLPEWFVPVASVLSVALLVILVALYRHHRYLSSIDKQN